MRRLAWMLAACLATPAAWAQPNLEAYRGMKPSTRPVCEERCNRIEFGGNTNLVEQEAKISQIRYQKKIETDLDKLKALSEQEQLLVDRRARQVGRMCKQICSHNPEN